MLLHREKPLPIGLDLGQESIKLLQLQSGQRGLTIRAAALHELPENTESRTDQRALALEATHRLLRSGGFAGRRVVACLPRELVHLKNIRLPVMPIDEVEGAVEFEAATAFGMDRSEILLRHIVAGEVRQGDETRLEVMMLAAKLAEVDTFVEALHRAGCQLEALDFEPNALFRSSQFHCGARPQREMQIVIDVGYRRTQVIIGQGSKLCFFKPVDIGARRLDAAVAKKLMISDAEAAALRVRVDSVSLSADRPDESVRQIVADAIRPLLEELAREVALCLRYCSVTFRGQRAARLGLVGGTAASTQLREIFSHNLPVPIEPALSLSSIDPRSCLRSDVAQEAWALPLGLAMRNSIQSSPESLAADSMDVAALAGVAGG